MATFESYPTVLLFLFMFLAIYVFGYFFVFRNWSPKIRPESCSCLISLFHGTPAVLLAGAAILSDTNRGFAAATTELQKLVLDYSIAYFIADLLHYLVFVPGDVLFIAHHLATLFVIFTCRHVVSHGAFAVVSLLILAEMTSSCQNVWSLARMRRKEEPFAAKVFDVLSLPFCMFYSVVRGLVGPYFMYKMAVFYVSGRVDGLIPKWVWISWVVVISTAIGVSIVWIYNLWVEIYRERRTKKLTLEEKIK